ncbi:unnamed protein product [Miscanthus lutarioriparius]|uniref:Topoisomerase 6 subunit A/Spo11 TOPRIM domain-containing protein n=1 Tax=Miscanthus lutarioriparius TaxID=422564 RepID=A0A811SJ65_9POAL|nr:unnamed protein product [Miscanthus lutarioriparius]
MEEWFNMCDHCHVHLSSSSHTNLLPSPNDGKLNVKCSLCKLICSYQIELDEDTSSSSYMTPPARSRLQHSNLGISQLSYATGHSQGDGDQSSIQGISGSLSDLSLSRYAVSQMSTSPAYDDKDVTAYDGKDVTDGKFGEDSHKGFIHRTLMKLKLSPEEIDELKKKYVIAESVSPKVALEKVNDALSTWSPDVGRYKLRMPGKAKEGLYVYDDTLGQICRLRKKTYLVARQKSLRFGELLLIIKGLLKTHTFLRLRLLHYMHPQLCRSTTPEQSMELLRQTAAELSVLLEVSRESLNLTASPQGVTVGPAILYVGGKELIDCNHGGASGNLIPCEAETIDKIEATEGVDIEYVLLVEKDTIFQYLASRNFHKKNNCVLITGGVPDVYTRILLRKYNDLLSVPIYALMDGNPSGAQIFSTYCFGSNEKAHENLFLTVQGLDFIGLFVRDILPENRSALTEDDQDTLSSLLKTKYIDRIEGLRSNLVFMDETKSKADIEMMMRQQSLESYILKSVQAAKNRRKVQPIKI